MFENVNTPVLDTAIHAIDEFHDLYGKRFPIVLALDVDDLLTAATYLPKEDNILEITEDTNFRDREYAASKAIRALEKILLRSYIEDEYREAGLIRKGDEYRIQLQGFHDWANASHLSDWQNEQEMKAQIANVIEQAKQQAN